MRLNSFSSRHPWSVTVSWCRAVANLVWRHTKHISGGKTEIFSFENDHAPGMAQQGLYLTWVQPPAEFSS